jgi:hypothetical protein
VGAKKVKSPHKRLAYYSLSTKSTYQIPENNTNKNSLLSGLGLPSQIKRANSPHTPPLPTLATFLYYRRSHRSRAGGSKATTGVAVTATTAHGGGSSCCCLVRRPEQASLWPRTIRAATYSRGIGDLPTIV